MNVQGGEAVMTDQSSAKSLLNISLCQIQLQGQIRGVFPSKQQKPRCWGRIDEFFEFLSSKFQYFQTEIFKFKSQPTS